MASCNHDNTRLWSTKRGVTRRCRDCGAVQALKPVDKQQNKKK